MSACKPSLPAEAGGTEITRFNALRQGVLSRYTVLPWEDEEEYRALVSALAAEHAPQGPTEEHLVEEIAGTFWRKRRLRLAEAAAHRRDLSEISCEGHNDGKEGDIVWRRRKQPAISDELLDQLLAGADPKTAFWREPTRRQPLRRTGCSTS